MLTQETWNNTNPWLREQAETTGKATAPVLAMDLAAKASPWRGTHRILEFILQVKKYFFIPGGQNGSSLLRALFTNEA